MEADKKLQAFETLMGELSSALADMVEAMQNKQAGTDEISATLVSMLEAIEAKNKGRPMDEVVAAIKGLRLQASEITVNVSPTPITIQPPATSFSDFELKCTYDNYDRLTSARWVPIQAK